MFVIKHDYADMGMVANSINAVKESGANILGCVLNAEKKMFSNNYHINNRYYKKYYSDYGLKNGYKGKYPSKQYVSANGGKAK